MALKLRKSGEKVSDAVFPFFFFFFLPYHLFLHRLENRTKPISTPYDGRRWWDSNLHVSRLHYHCATDANKVSLVFICEKYNYLFFKSVVHLGLHGDFSCLQVCFCFVLFCFLLLDMKMLNKLYVFLSTACVSVPLLITVLIPS